jgi:hypothetical protein
VYAGKKARVSRVEARRRSLAAALPDRSPWDWYGESCPCGLPPGECRRHPRARASQRPPPGDWRVWACVAVFEAIRRPQRRPSKRNAGSDSARRVSRIIADVS